MLKKFNPNERNDFVEMCKDFYSSDAVTHNVEENNFLKTYELCLTDNPYAEGYFIVADGQNAGYCLLSYTYSNEAGGINAWIEEIYLKQEFRGKGLGKRVLSELEKLILPETVRIRLELTPVNISAMKLYEKCGYEKLDYLQMVKEL